MKITYKHLILLLLLLLHSFTAAAPIPTKQEASANVAISIKVFNVQRASYFHNTPAQTDDTPNITASGYRLTDSSKVIAVSRDLLPSLPYGTVVYLSIGGNKEKYTVQDTMNKRFRNSIDVFAPKGGKIFPEKKLFVL